MNINEIRFIDQHDESDRMPIILTCNTCGTEFKDSELTEYCGLSGMPPGCPVCGNDDLSEKEE